MHEGSSARRYQTEGTVSCGSADVLCPVGGARPTSHSAERVAMFVDECNWHACPQHGTLPKANASWWRAKLDANVGHDQDTARRLRDAEKRLSLRHLHALGELSRSRESILQRPSRSVVSRKIPRHSWPSRSVSMSARPQSP
jgi:G:T-mismatch repair DNA endonuclease (very short patch repair protein)